MLWIVDDGGSLVEVFSGTTIHLSFLKGGVAIVVSRPQSDEKCRLWIYESESRAKTALRRLGERIGAIHRSSL